MSWVTDQGFFLTFHGKFRWASGFLFGLCLCRLLELEKLLALDPQHVGVGALAHTLGSFLLMLLSWRDSWYRRAFCAIESGLVSYFAFATC
jgi:hypothetical protein